jgi:mannitol-1-phosphate 5-dehydrogenase
MSAKHFLGFGFGPIQSGLMLLEAQASGAFDRFVIAEILPELVEAVRANGNRIAINIAHADRIETRTLPEVELYNPRVPADRAALADAVRDADELATAIPSVDLYAAGGDTSIAALLAHHLDAARPRILYASENNNYAAERLGKAIAAARGTSAPDPARPLPGFQILNTVVGKMSGIIDDPAVIRELGLAPFVPKSPRAVLVEAFNHILVSKVTLPGFTRGIAVFEEKDALLPFEEAKLFGHNAIHALLGYLAAGTGLQTMSEIRAHADLMDLGRRAFLEESGAALLRKHGALDDPLFTPDGFAAYAEDLLQRMTNPWLHDEVRRICRDPRRKLGYGDRLVGAMRLALEHGVRPAILARGTAHALRYLVAERPDAPDALPRPAAPEDCRGRAAEDLLHALWDETPDDGRRAACIALILDALDRIA